MINNLILACKESIEEQLMNYDKQLNEWIGSLEGNEENDKNIENYENFTDTGKRAMNKLKGIILGFKHHMESIEKEKTHQFEKTMRKERLELEKQEHERELELKKTEMELAYKEKLEMERLQVKKLRLQNEKELKCTEIEINGEESNQQNSGQRATYKSTVKLPKFELMKFDGNLLKWQEFWDLFHTIVNRNPSLEDIDKLNYLPAQLRDEAKVVIAGLEVTSTSYAVAVDLLKERYSNKQLMIDAHYSTYQVKVTKNDTNQTGRI